jgi:hypothetical protein
MKKLSKKGGAADHRTQITMSDEESLAYLLDHESICGADKPRSQRIESKRNKFKRALARAFTRVLVFN